MLTYLQAAIVGLLQGITELFPVSSLGHSVVLPSLLGWKNLIAAQSAPESFFLAFLVGLHVATAVALIVFFHRDWIRLIQAFFHTVKTRRIETADERLIWLLIAATIPAGITGLVFEHLLRVLFARPLLASIFLIANGLILLAGERLRRRAPAPPSAVAPEIPVEQERIGDILRTSSAANRAPRGSAPALSSETCSLANLSFLEAVLIGAAQVFALLAGISRSGITMVAGLGRGLSHEDAARFSFLLATPIIMAAGLFKLPDLIGRNGDGVRGQILVGSVVAAIAAYLSVRYLTRYFRTRTLTPFALYCLAVGIGLTIRFALF